MTSSKSVYSTTLTCFPRRKATLTPNHVTWSAQAGGRVEQLTNRTLRHVGSKDASGIGTVVVLSAVVSLRGDEARVLSARCVDVWRE